VAKAKQTPEVNKKLNNRWNCAMVIRKDLKIASERLSTTIAMNGPLLGDALSQMALLRLMDGSKEGLQGTRNSSDRFNLPGPPTQTFSIHQ
jgi:hypothetical protein